MSVIDDIHFMVGKIDGKVDALIAQGAVQDDRTMKLEGRVRALENSRHWYAGAAAGVSALLTATGMKWFGH